MNRLRHALKGVIIWAVVAAVLAGPAPFLFRSNQERLGVFFNLPYWPQSILAAGLTFVIALVLGLIGIAIGWLLILLSKPSEAR